MAKSRRRSKTRSRRGRSRPAHKKLTRAARRAQNRKLFRAKRKGRGKRKVGVARSCRGKRKARWGSKRCKSMRTRVKHKRGRRHARR